MSTLYPGFVLSKSTAFRFEVRISMDLAHKTLPLFMLTTGSSEPIRTMTEPSSKPNPMILLFYLEVSATQPMPRLYSRILRTE